MHAKRLWAFVIVAAASAASCITASGAAFTNRYGNTTTLLPDGNLLIIGGAVANGTPISGAGSVQLSIEAESAIENMTAIPTAVASHTATLLNNGEVLVAGGDTGAHTGLGAIQVYNPLNNCWHGAVAMTARYNHTANLLKDGRVLICGGESAGAFINTCTIFTPTTVAAACGSSPGTVTATPSLLTTRALHTATQLADGRIFITGGLNASGYLVTSEIFNPDTDSVGAGRSLISRRAYHRATLMGNGKVLIAGGYNDRNFEENRGFLDTAEIYDPIADSMIPAGRMSVRKSEFSLVTRNDGVVSTYAGLGNVTTTYQQGVSGDINSSSLIAGCFAPGGACTGDVPTPQSVLSTTTIDTAGSTLLIDFSHQFRTASGGAILPVTGVIDSGVVLFSSAAIALPNGGQVKFVDGQDQPRRGAYIDLAGTSVFCDPQAGCGVFGGTFQVNAQGQTIFGVPDAQNPDIVLSAGSQVTFAGPINQSDGPTPITGGTLNGQVFIEGLPKNYIGATVLNGTVELLSASVSSEGVVAFSFTDGDDDITPGTVLQNDGKGGASILFSASFINLAGDVLGLSTNDVASPFTDIVGKILSSNVRLTFALDRVTLNDNNVFDAKVATVIVAAMTFGDLEDYNPLTNTWSLSTHGASVFGQTGTLVPTSNTRQFGGRNCAGVRPCPVRGVGSTVVQKLTSWSTINGSGGDGPIRARGNHTATLLPNKKILLAGGTNGQNVLSSAELFDPERVGTSSGARPFRNTGSMHQPRDMHTATLLPNGNVLVAGGFTTNATSTGSTNGAEIFYPASNAWVETSPMPYQAHNHSATLLPDGNVLVAGGYRGTDYLNTAAIYYSTAARWVQLPNMPATRALHTATILQDGRVLLAGGINENGVLSTSLIFDMNTAGYWLAGPAMPLGVHSHSAVSMPKGQVLVVGGNDGFGETNAAMTYTPAAAPAIGSWTNTAAVKAPNFRRFGQTATLLPNGIVAIIGGAQSLGNSLAAVETFDVSLTTWTIQLGMSAPRVFHTTTMGPDGKIYVIGGFGGTSMHQDAESLFFNGRPDNNSLGADTAVRQSSITAVDMPTFDRGSHVTLTGSKLLQYGESSGGSGPAGSSHHGPRVVMQGVEGSGGGGSMGGGTYTVDLTTRVYRSADPNLWTNIVSSLTLQMPGDLPTDPHLGGTFLPYGWYQLRTYGNALFSKSVMVQAGPAKPTLAPGGIAATVHGTSSITWNWSQVAETVDGYAVYSASSAIFIGTSPVPVSALSAASHTQVNLAPNTTASIYVAAYTLSGDGPLTFSNTFYTLSTCAVSVAISSVGFDRVQVTWDANQNAPGTIYEIYQSTDAFTTSFSTPVPREFKHISTSALITQLSQNTVYSFRLVAINGSNLASNYSAIVSTRTRAPVIGLSGTPQSTTEIEWRWVDPGGGVANYRVYNSTSGELLGTPTTPVFMDIGLSTNSRRSVRVSAVSSGSEGPLSASATVYTMAAVPGNVTPGVSNVSTNSFTAAWSANGNPLGTRYVLVVYDHRDLLLSTASVTQATFGGYSGFGNTSEPFSVRVLAMNEDDVQSAFSFIGSSSTLAQSPSDLHVIDTTPSSISIAWDTGRNGSTTTYEVTYSSDNFVTTHTPLRFLDRVTTSSFTVAGLVTSTTYTFRVQARNVLEVRTAFSNSVTTAPFNGGVPLGSLGIPISANENTTVTGAIGSGRLLTLQVPAGTFPSDTFLTISTFNASGLNSVCSGGLDIGISVTPAPSMQPTKPMYITVAYTDAEMGTGDPAKATLQRINEATGRCSPLRTTVDTSRKEITAALNHLSRFQLSLVTPSSAVDSALVFPNPFYASRGNGFVTFAQMPAGTRVRVFTMRGELLFDQSANAAGIVTWPATNQQGRSVASGVYLATLEGNGNKKIMKVVVIR